MSDRALIASRYQQWAQARQAVVTSRAELLKILDERIASSKRENPEGYERLRIQLMIHAQKLKTTEQIAEEAWAKYVWERDEKREAWARWGTVAVGFLAGVAALATALQAWAAFHPRQTTPAAEVKCSAK